MVAVCPPFSSFTIAPAIGVVPVSVTIPLIFAIQSETPANPVSNALIGTMKTSSWVNVLKIIVFTLVYVFFHAPFFLLSFERVALL